MNGSRTMTRPTDKEMEAAIREIIENPGPRWPGQTYEQGVRNALEWAIDKDEDHPLTD